jgi:hypothetical protein
MKDFFNILTLMLMVCGVLFLGHWVFEYNAIGAYSAEQERANFTYYKITVAGTVYLCKSYEVKGNWYVLNGIFKEAGSTKDDIVSMAVPKDKIESIQKKVSESKDKASSGLCANESNNPFTCSCFIRSVGG